MPTTLKAPAEQPSTQAAAPATMLMQLLAIAPAIAHLVLLAFLWQAGVLTSTIVSASIAVTLPIFMLSSPIALGKNIKGLGPINLYWIVLLSVYVQEGLAWFVIFIP
jgi:hypothetical protein